MRAFIDLHSYGQLCECIRPQYPGFEADYGSHVPFCVLMRRLPARRGDAHGGGPGRRQSDAHEPRRGVPGWTGVRPDLPVSCLIPGLCQPLTYRAPGDAIDFAYGVVDARWSYSAELRDTGTVSPR